MKMKWIATALVLFPAITLAQSERPATRPSAAGSTPSQVMDDLLKPPTTQPKPLVEPPTGVAIDKTSGKGALAPKAPPVPVMREGTNIFDRVGRLTRTADGSQAQFVFDSDGKTLKDPPVIILPNLKLQQVEDVLKGANRDIRFRVSGTITEYRGRNYLLLEKVTVPSETAAQF